MKITIFGLAGTGKSTTAKLISEKLGYEYMSTGNIFRSMAKEHDMTLNEFEALCESNEKYDRELDEIRVTEYGKANDNFVFESRLAWHFIPDSIKIRLYCNDEERLQRVAYREDKKIDVVRMETEYRENSIRKRYKSLYEIDDLDNPNNFDLNIDTTNNSVEKVVQTILDYIK
jgi:predicted cytidylate kinase